MATRFQFSSEETESIDLEVHTLLQKGAIRDANLFVIPKKIGDLRPVINKKKKRE